MMTRLLMLTMTTECRVEGQWRWIMTSSPATSSGRRSSYDHYSHAPVLNDDANYVSLFDTRDAESSFFVGLRLRVKVGHLLLNLCDCDSSVLSEWCRHSNSQNLKWNNNPILLLSIISLYYVRLWNRYGLCGVLFFWQDSDSDAGPGLEFRLWGLRLQLRTPVRHKDRSQTRWTLTPQRRRGCFRHLSSLLWPWPLTFNLQNLTTVTRPSVWPYEHSL